MDKFYVPLDRRTEAQERQAEETEALAKKLRYEDGIECEVRQYFCTSEKDDSACIVLSKNAGT